MADLDEAATLIDTVDNSSDSEFSSDETTPSHPIEWLATSRAKRSTAGTRMTSLIQAEAEDDELELLFAEDENDEGFEIGREGGDDSDVQMDSSDDDEDQGPPAPGVEELDGEKELLRRERMERGKKRKNDHLPKAFQVKRAKGDPLVPVPLKKTPPRPKKKSERASWIPTVDDAPVRVSHRSTTMDAKERLYREMEERERKRLKQLANMERAAAKKAAQKKPEKTQEDRLAEAARIEKANAKSLNRWEEAERTREEEARARLEALHNRKMEGPVITWWSGKATYVGDKLRQVGKHVQVEEPPLKVPRKKRPSEMGLGDSATAKARLERQLAAQSNGQHSGQSSGTGASSISTPVNGSAAAQGASTPKAQQPPQPMHATPAMLNGSTPLSGLSAPPSASGSPFSQPLSGPLASSPSPTTPVPQLSTGPPPSTPSSFTPPTNGNIAQSGTTPSLPSRSSTSPLSAPNANPLLSAANPHANGSAISSMPTPTLPSPAAQPSAGQILPPQTPSITTHPQQLSANPSRQPSALPATSAASTQVKAEQSSPMTPRPFMQPTSQQPRQASPPGAAPQSDTNLSEKCALPVMPPPPPPPPPPITFATTSRIILSSFQDAALREKSVLNAILFRGNRFTKLPRPSAPPTCAITGLPAKYKDPKTGLWYSSSYAFKEIRRLEKGEYRWSGLVGGYVGGVDRVVNQANGNGVATQLKRVDGAASGVPARFFDPNAPAPPKVVKQEIKPMTTPMQGVMAGSMAPPPLPQLPNVPSSDGMVSQQPIMTPLHFGSQNPVQRVTPTASTTVPALNSFKQASPATSLPFKQTAPGTMQTPQTTGQSQSQPQMIQRNSQFAPSGPTVSGSVAAPTAPIQLKPVLDVAVTAAPIASTVAAVAPVVATTGPLPATVPAAAVASAPPPAQPNA